MPLNHEEKDRAIRRIKAETPKLHDSSFPPFEISISDGCTGVRQLAQSCCIIHDFYYHHGVSIWDKWRADRALVACIIRHGWRECSAAREPWASFIVWVLLGLVRGLAVGVFAWRPFFGKDHKRRLTWRQKLFG